MSAAPAGLNDIAVEAENSASLGEASAVARGAVAVSGLNCTSCLVPDYSLGLFPYATVDLAQPIVAGSVVLKTGSAVGAIYADRVTNSGGSYTTHSPFAVPPALPPASPVAPGATRVTVAQGATEQLAAGQYAGVEIKNKATLRLVGGLYQLKSLTLGAQSRLEILAGAELRIEGRLATGQGCYVGPAGAVTLSAKDLRIEVSAARDNPKSCEGTAAAAFGESNTLRALVLAPNGTLVLAPHTTANGAFFGRDVKIGQGCRINFEDGFHPNTCSPPDCDDRNACSKDVCAAGVCSHAPVAAGTSCSDDNACNGSEVCDGAGVCKAGTPITCTPKDQCHDAGICDPATGSCPDPAKPDGAACNDGNACTTDTCQGGQCQSSPLYCPQIAQTCQLGPHCDPQRGPCVYDPVRDGTACGDGNVCNGDELCVAGACTQGVPPSVDDGNPCTVDACDPALGVSHLPVADGAACPDGDLCNGDEVCQSGICTPAPVVPPLPPPGMPNTCTGTLEPAPANSSSYFDDPVPALMTSASEVVLRKELGGYGNYGVADGQSNILYGGQAATWSFVLPDSVDAAAVVGAFVRTSIVADDHYGAAIDGYRLSAWVNGTQLAASCRADLPHGTPYGQRFDNWVQRDYATPVGITTTLTLANRAGDWLAIDWIELHVLLAREPVADDGNPCTVDICDPDIGTMHTPTPVGVPCPDLDVCNGSETCDGAGACRPGTPPSIDDGNPCTIDSCAPATGVVHMPVADGTSCSDGNACNGDEVCKAGQCAVPAPSEAGICTDFGSTPAHWWRGENDFLDQTGQATGTATAGVAFAPGKVGQAFDFDGAATTGIRINGSEELNFQTLTMDAWVFPRSLPNAYPTILRKSTGPCGTGLYSLALTQDGQAHCSINGGGPVGGHVCLQKWSHVACTYDGSVIRLYVDGTLVASQAQAGPLPVLSDPMWIGLENPVPGCSSRQFDGLIDEPTIFDRALSAMEIQTIYQAGGAGKCTPRAKVPVPNVIGLSPGAGEAAITAAHLGRGVVNNIENPIRLKFGPLPSVQGWPWGISDSVGLVESDLFSVQDGFLHQDTRGIGNIGAGYTYLFTASEDAVLPFTFEVRSRTLQETDIINENPYGFMFYYYTSSLAAAVAVTPNSVHAGPNGDQPNLSLDGTAFHNFLLESTGAEGGHRARLHVDGTLAFEWSMGDGSGSRDAFLGLGDGTRGANALADVASLTFRQPRITAQVPAAGTLVDPDSLVDITVSQSSRPPQPPFVTAGPDQTTAISASATLSGSAVDDGLPRGLLSTTWTRMSGPESVVFADAASASTTASFSASGSYVLRLTASDGESSASDDVTVTVSSPCDGAPIDDANTCTTDACDPGVGVTHTPLSDGASCNDGNPCTQTDLCQSGICVGTDPIPDLEVTGCSTPGPLNSGCADGTREGFADRTQYPDIAGCSGGWSVPGIMDFNPGTAPACPNVQTHDTITPACNRNAGNDSSDPNGTGCDVADLCSAGWHVCVTATDVSIHSPDGCTGVTQPSDPPLFFATRQSSTGCAACSTGLSFGPECGANTCASGCAQTAIESNDLFGCGNFGSAISCGPLNRFSQDQCGSLGAPWNCADGAGGQCEAYVITKPAPTAGGVMCCRDMPPPQCFGKADGAPCNDDSACTQTDSCQGGQCVGSNPAPDGTICTDPSVCNGSRACQAGTCTCVPSGSNRAPNVNAGLDQIALVGDGASLEGSASDDGLPTGSSLATEWTQAGGPAAVAFANPASATTSASAGAPGRYTLRLTASDGELSASDDMLLCAAAPNQRFIDDFEASSLGKWVPVSSGCCQGGAVEVAGGQLHTGTGYGEAPGASEHKMFATPVTFSPRGGGVVARASVRLGGDYQGLGFGLRNSVGSQGALYVAFNTLERAGDGARPHHIHALVEERGADGKWSVAFDHELPAFWYDVFHELAIEWRQTEARFRIDGVLLATAPVALDCNADFGIFNNRPQLMETDWVEVYSIGEPNNAPPTVNAGPDAAITLPAALTVTAAVTDDGNPSGSSLALSWTTASGPGAVTFSPSNSAATTVSFDQPGTYVLRLTASDGEVSGRDELTVVVNPQVTEPPTNRPPAVVCHADRNLLQQPDDTVAITCDLSDDDLPAGAPLTTQWFIESPLPEGPAVLEFTATSIKARLPVRGDYVFTLRASDSEFQVEASVPVTLLPPNTAPTVGAGPDLSVTLPGLASLTAVAHDDGLPSATLVFAWSQLAGPGAVVFGDPSAAATTAAFPQPGSYRLRVTVSDGELTAFDDVDALVRPPQPNAAPTVSAGPDLEVQLPVNGVQLVGSVTDDGLPAGSTLARLWQRVSGPGTVQFTAPTTPATTATFSTAGRYVLRLTASDGELSATDDVTVMVWAAPGNGTVDVALESPAEDSVITSPTAVTGSATGTDLFEWYLEYRPADGTAAWVRFAGGNTTVSPGTLGSFDPTLLLNGIYELRLSAVGLSREVASTALTVSVEGNQKVGNFTVSFRDLSVPVAGIPIEVIRTYDSRDKRKGDFGVGWTLDIKSVSVQKNRVVGQTWDTTVEASGPFGGAVEAFCVVPGKRHYVTVTFADGKVLRWEAHVIAPGSGVGGRRECQLGADFAEASVEFQPLAPNTATLTRVGANAVLVNADWPGTAELVSEDGSSLFDPDKFIVTLHDGRELQVAQSTGLEQLKDSNGNVLEVRANGLFHSTGASVAFQRDSLGRITSIIDPDGKSIAYAYGATGDLDSLTDRVSSKTQYAYDGNHYLLGIEDARGLHPIQNEYDSSGRLLKNVDAFGNQIAYDHDLVARTETVTDRLGNETKHEYDDRGNVLKTTDALGHAATYSYDDRDNKLSECNPLHQCSTYTYDDFDNKLTETDPLGHSTSYTYDGRGNVLTTTDPLGHVITNGYDANGNLTSSKDAAGNVTSYTYDSHGLQRSMTDALGHVTAYGYDANGDLASETDALGHITTYGYDTNGNRLSQTATRTNSSGAVETLTTLFAYDGAGRLIATTHPDGSTTETEYDAIGQQAATIDALGRRTERSYDALGRLSATHYPDGTSDATTYDAEGRRKTSTDRAGHVTSFGYDAVGRLLATTMPDGAVTSTSYDDAGRTLNSTDEAGAVTSYGYDAAGRRTSVTDALGHATTTTYDGAGNELTTVDALGHTTTYGYDSLGRRTTVAFADGTQELTGYDALGRRTSKTDQAGVVTHYGYDALGRLTSVIDALGGLTQYGYDEQGNQLTQIDALGHTTRFDYNEMGRRTRRTLPSVAGTAAFETMSYDDGGNLASKTDFIGRTTHFTYDAANRLLHKTYPDSSTVSFTYTPNGRRATATDARGTTSYSYDSRDRIVSMTYPDGRALAYGYDARGSRTSLTAHVAGATLATSYTYDTRGALSEVTDPNGGHYTYSYDPAGARTALTQPNGVATSYSYDALHHLTSLVTTHVPTSTTIQSYVYTLGPTGIRTQIAEQDGTLRAYGYDPLYRLTDETVTGSANTDYTKHFAYDAAGNRLQQTTTGYGAAAVGYAYDDRDRLLTENTVAYGWDANGNMTSRAGDATYSWDFDDRLVRVQKADGTVVQYTYDVDGVRVRTVVTPAGGGAEEVTEYLVDTAGALSQVVATTDGGGALTAYYVRGGDQLLAVLRGSEARYYEEDGLGSVRILANGSGMVSTAYGYTAFGEALSQTSQDVQPYRFAGEEWDRESSQQFHRARYLDPRLGVFASMDVHGGIAAMPYTLQKYRYGGSDPINLRDPSGAFSIAELTTTVGVQEIVSRIAFTHILFPGLAITVEYALYKPAFENRNNAIFLISQTDDPEVIRDALDVYEEASRAIAVASDLIRLADAFTKLGQATVGLSRSFAKAMDANSTNALSNVANGALVLPNSVDILTSGSSVAANLSQLGVDLRTQPSHRAVPPFSLTTSLAVTRVFYKLVFEVASKIRL